MPTLSDLLGGLAGLPGLGTTPGLGPDPLAGLGAPPTLPEAGNFADTAMPEGVAPTFNPYDTGFDQPDLRGAGALPVPFTPQQVGAPMALGNLLGGSFGTDDAVAQVGTQMRDAERAARPLDVAPTRDAYDDEADDEAEYKLPGFKQTLMERGIPALVAALAGAFGGGQAAATGMLSGSAKGLNDQRALELETAKLEAARRDRKRARRDANQQREWQRLQDRATATNSLMQRLREFEDPAAGLAWLRSTSVRDTYARMGIDTNEIGGALAPEQEARLRKEARGRYKDTLANLREQYKGKQLPDTLLDDVALDFHGVKMTLRELADYGGEGALGKDAVMRLAPEHPGTFEAQVEGAFKTFETTTGRPPDTKEQSAIVLKEREKWTAAGRDPLLAKFLLNRLEASDQTRRTEAQMARHYDKGQLALMVQLENQYSKVAIPFAAKARFFNEIRDTAPRALHQKDGSAGSPIAQTRMIFQYMKMLDEASAVRASEQRQVRDARGIPNWVLDLYWQAKDGQVLNDDIILQIVQEAKSTYEGAKQQHYQFAEPLVQQGLRRGIDPWDIVRDYNAFGDPMGGPQDKGWAYKRPRRRSIDAEGTITEDESDGTLEPGEVPGRADPAPRATPPPAESTPASQAQVDFGTAGRTSPAGTFGISPPVDFATQGTATSTRPLSPGEIRAGGARPEGAGVPRVQGVPGGARGLPGAKPTGTIAAKPTGPTVPATKQSVQVGRIVVAYDGSKHVVTGVPASGGGVETRRVELKNGRYVYADGGPDDGQPVVGQ